MPTKPPSAKPHLLLKTTAPTHKYTYPKRIGGTALQVVARDRGVHGQRLKAELGQVQAELPALALARSHKGIPVTAGSI